MNETFARICIQTITEAQALLRENAEWNTRFAKYAKRILCNTDTIKRHKRKFNEWAPLFLYMNVSQAMRTGVFSLRYLGQDVGVLAVKGNDVTFSTKGFEKKNEGYFNCAVKTDGHEWRSKEMIAFRNHFLSNPPREHSFGRGRKEEHRIESLLLTEFARRNRKDKPLCNIQPIKLAGVARFQMPTPFGASKQIKYAKKGGGIDILARVGVGKGTKLCIMELKDENTENESASAVIQQALAYGTFVHTLLRSQNGATWWKIFGFNGKLPDRLEIYIACVMPSKKDTGNDVSFGNQELAIPTVIQNGHKDTFRLHYVYFTEGGGRITDVETSFQLNRGSNRRGCV